MPTFISLLRGINVSGQRKTRMAELGDVYQMLGLTNVETYLQSGNVVFNCKMRNASKIAILLEQQIEVSFGYDVTVMVRTPGDFFDAVGSKALGFNQDPVNFVASLDEAYDLKPFLQEFFDLLGDVTFGAHAKDFKIANTLLVWFEEEEIGRGLIPHDYFLTELQKCAPDAHVLIEHLPPNKFANAIREFKVYSDRAGIAWGEPSPPQV